MPYNVRDRVQDTTTVVGTGDVTCTGSTPVAGYVDFNTALNNSDTFYYLIEAVDSSGVATGAFEIGLGTVASKSPCVFHRTAIINSSNGGIGGSAVSFAAGTKRIHLTAPATQIGPLVCTTQLAATLTVQNFQGSGTGAAIPFTSTNPDTSYNQGLSRLHDNITNTTRITIPAYVGDSYVRLFGQVGVQNVTAADTLELFIKQSGSMVAHNSAVAASGFITQTLQVVTPVLYAVGGDYFELFLATGADTSISVMASPYTRFGIEIL